MSFNSFSYFLFLPLVYLIFVLMQQKARWILLLLSSFAFYATLKEPFLLVVLAVVIILTYVLGIVLHSTCSDVTKKLAYCGGVAVNLLVLAGSKYIHSLVASLPLLTGGADGLVTIGISYFTFQAISYLTDVFLKGEEPERHFGYFALYMAFFPKLLQGPIERSSSLIPQLKQPYTFTYQNARTGIILFLWGVFQKAVVADRLALYVNPVYDNVHSHSGLIFVVATIVYAFQIYFDFSGYTDMALGTARLFNIHLTPNFDRPYLATSVSDFWRRWHISFSRWILDYIFTPAQFYLRKWKTYGVSIALLVTFLASGIWHGARWGFVIWGLLHGTFMAVSVVVRPWRKKLLKRLNLQGSPFLKVWDTVGTFCLVSFAWIFFRSNSLDDALFVIRSIFSAPIGSFHSLHSQLYQDNMVLGNDLQLTLATVLCTTVAVFVSFTSDGVIGRYQRSPRFLRYSACYGTIFMIIAYGIFNRNSFIYFKF